MYGLAVAILLLILMLFISSVGFDDAFMVSSP